MLRSVRPRRTDHAGGDRGIEAQRTADGHGQLPDAQRGGIAQRGEGQPVGIGLHDGQVGPGIGADHAAGQLAAVGQPDADLGLVLARRDGW